MFWDITPPSPLKVNRRFGGTCPISIFRVEEQAKQETSVKALLATCFHVGFFLGVMFLRNVGWLSTDYAALYPRRQYRCENLKLNVNFKLHIVLRYIGLRMRWAGHVTRIGDMRNAYKILWEHLKGRGYFGDFLEDNINIVVREVVCNFVGWIVIKWVLGFHKGREGLLEQLSHCQLLKEGYRMGPIGRGRVEPRKRHLLSVFDIYVKLLGICWDEYMDLLLILFVTFCVFFLRFSRWHLSWQVVGFLTCVLGMGSSNLPRDVDYSECGFSWFTSVPPG
jgi:uncharacterized membrane protein